MSKIIANQISPRSGDNITINGNLSVGGTVTYEDVSNVDSVGIVTAGGGIRIGTGGTIGPVGSGIVTYYGDGSKLTGIDASSLQDSGGTVRVQANTSGAVVTGVLTSTSFVTGVLTATSFSGDGSGLTFTPKILAFDPAALSTGVAADKTITITFDQNISFSGNGTVELRSGSAGGSVIQSFAISSGTPATGLSIVGTQLIINPTSNFADNTVVYVILPSTGIVNSVGSAYGGSNSYNFQTVVSSFSAQGGDFDQVIASGDSSTGYYRYHIFTNPGILTTTSNTNVATGFKLMMIAGGGAGSGNNTDGNSQGGGGGAGGLLDYSGPELSLSANLYNITIGNGGTLDNMPPTGIPNALYPTMSGDDTTIASPVYTLTAIGGGAGGTQPISPVDKQAGLIGGSGGGATQPYGEPTTRAGAIGTPGQGNPGGTARTSRSYPGSPGPQVVSAGGGGGGAGGAGSSGNIYQTNYSASQGGWGGVGKQVPEFSSSVLSSRVPSALISTLTWSTLGPTGSYWAGGGGGGGSWKSAGGHGGGGNGYGPWDPTSTTPNDGPTVPNGPYPVKPSIPVNGLDGTGGGGGGSSSLSQSGVGGKGVVMIRYETPAP